VDLNDSLTALVDQARSVCGEDLEGSLLIDLKFWRLHDGQMHWACAAIDKMAY
jgi:hypothetical protein